MKDQPASGSAPAGAAGALGLPVVVAIAAARRRLPLTEMDAGLDCVPMGREEGGQPMSWLRRHDEYHNR